MKAAFMTIALLVALALLGGCGNANTQDLQAWTARVKARPSPKLKPIPELAPYQTYAYPAGDLRSPFVAVAAKPVSNVHPNRLRKKEYLERFPLDALKFVGEISYDGTTYALIQDPEGVVHRVHDGMYLGQNNGRVVAIQPAKVEISEIVPDGTGGYERRPSSLSLAGTNGG